MKRIIMSTLPVIIPSQVEKLELKKIQRFHAGHIAKSIRFGGQCLTLDGSVTGSGKTPCTLEVARATGMNLFIIAPKTILYGWLRSEQRWGYGNIVGHTNYELAIRGKQAAFGINTKGNVKIESEICPYITTTPNPKAQHDQYAWKNIFGFSFPAKTLFVFDEAHRLKNRGSQQQDFAMQLLLWIQAHPELGCHILLLSATIAEDPLRMAIPAAGIGLYDPKSPWEFYTKFAVGFGCQKEVVNAAGTEAWHFDGKIAHISALHKEFFPEHGHRMRYEDIEGFPKTLIIPELVPIDPLNYLTPQHQERLEVLREFEVVLERIMGGGFEVNPTSISEVRRIRERMAHTMHQSTEEIGRIEKLGIPEAHSLQLVYRQCKAQIAELEKLPIIAEAVLEALDQGKFCPIFVKYTCSVDALNEFFITKKVRSAFFDGRNVNTRMNHLRDFQANRIAVLVCNIAAAKEGIDMHDTTGDAQRVAFFTPTDSAQDLKQAFGRCHRVTGKSVSIQYVFCAAGTVEEKVYKNVRAKMERIETLNDDDLRVDVLSDLLVTNRPSIPAPAIQHP